MEKIVSPYGDIQKTIDMLNADTPLTKFAYEFCTEFNVQVQARSSDSMKVFSTEGVKLGIIYTETHRSNSTGANETVYFFESNNIIKKAKGTSRSNSYTRDANKIKSARSPSVSIKDSLTIDLIEYALLDKPISTEQNEELAQAYKDYQLEMKKFLSSTKEKSRFAQGVKAIGIFRENAKSYYLVGEADYINGDVNIHGDLKRYESLKDEPEFSSDILMIRTYMQAQNSCDDTNEFGLPRRDIYYPEIDVSTTVSRQSYP